MRMLGPAGSLRNGCVNRRLLAVAREAAPPEVEVDVFEALGRLPLFNEDDDVVPAPAAVDELRKGIRAADAVLIATPEYNSSIPGPLKNALDWLSRPAPAPLAGKPVAVVGASPSGYGAVWAQEQVQKVAAAIGALVLDRNLPVPHAHQVLGHESRLSDPELQGRLEDLLGEFIAFADASSASRVAPVA